MVRSGGCGEEWRGCVVRCGGLCGEVWRVVW